MEETAVINSVTDLLEQVKRLDLQADSFMFRGHSQWSWSLVPAIGRMYSSLIDYQDWNLFETELIGEFRQYSRPFLTAEPRSWVEWLVVAQHHGLPTRLLDWTTNPIKALFFAVDDPRHQSDGALWAFEPGLSFRGSPSSTVAVPSGDMGWIESAESVEQLESFFPDHLNPRVIAQESCFTLFPFPKTATPIPPLEERERRADEISQLFKFRVPGNAKPLISRELRQLGITYRTLFPDLEGLATSIRREYNLSW